MNGIQLGQYVHGHTFIHLLDPRTKILCCLTLIVCVFVSNAWYYLLLHLLLLGITIAWAGLNFPVMFKSLMRLKYFFLITFILQAFLTPGQPIFTIGKLGMTREGMVIGAINIARLIILFLVSMVLLMTTSPLKLSAGIEYLLQPLSRLKIPVYHFTTIISISFRFIPTLLEEATTIKKAQKSRGAPFHSPKIKTRLKAYTAILIPLFEASLARAADLGEAMDSRCFTPNANKLRLSSLKMTGKDYLVLMLMVALLCSGIITKFI